MTARAFSQEDPSGDHPGSLAEAVGFDDNLVVRLPARAVGLRRIDSSQGLLAASPAALRFKRGLDIVVSLVLLALLAPLFFLLAAAVKFSSPGPVLYWSTRVGQGGPHVPIAKFRSMFVDAEDRLATLVALNEASGPVFKIRDDPRMTAMGRMLRKTSLDELPQLWNVLIGDMTLVGPRPALPSEASTYTEFERQRLLVKPGLTCIWQVSGRSDLDFNTWMHMDLDYIESWTPWLDLKLLAQTVPAVVTGKGAY